MHKTPSLRDLEHHEAFVERHIGPNDAEIAQMLRVVGHDSLDATTDAIVPGPLRSKDALALPPSMTDVEPTAKNRSIPVPHQDLPRHLRQSNTATQPHTD